MNSNDAFRSLSSGVRFKKKNTQRVDQSTGTSLHLSDNAQLPSAPSGGKVTNPEDSQSVRKIHKIRCTGEDLPEAWNAFAKFATLPTELLANIENMGIMTPSPIQMQAPSIMLARRDLLACAPTGSGKTIAFLLPLYLASRASHPSKSEGRTLASPLAIVIEPTRELARQVFSEASRLKSGLDWGIRLLGENEEKAEMSSRALPKRCDFVITTPLRLVHAIKDGSIDVSCVEYLVLDEADRLFELGFLTQTDEIIAACSSPKLAKAMFSATIPSGVEELAKSVMSDNMIRVIIGGSDIATKNISQRLVFTGNEDGKLLALKNMVKGGNLTPPALLFVQSVERAKDLNKELQAQGIVCDCMHAERTKEERDSIVQRFATGKVWALVCTDVMSRGVDFRGVELVLNYDFPQSVQSYIHRIGRTGRAGRTGEAVTFFTKDDASYLRSIVNIMRNSGCEVPEWMLSLKAPSQNAKKRLRTKPVERKDVSQAKGSLVGKKRGKRLAERKAKKVRTEGSLNQSDNSGSSESDSASDET